MVAPLEARRLRLRDVALDGTVAADAPAAVGPVRPVAVAGGRQVAGALAVHEDGADPRAVRQLARDADHGEVAGRGLRVARARLHVEEAHVEAAELAREARAPGDRDHLARRPDPDPAREEEVHLSRGAEREQARVLEEEGPLLRVEEAEAVEVDLLLVDLDLREVGVHRRVEGEARRDAPLEVAARGGRRVAGLPERRLLGGLPERVGQQLEVALRRGLEAGQGARPREPEQVVLAGERRPERALVAPAHVALQVQAPLAAALAPVAQRGERDRELGAPAEVAAARLHDPRPVPVAVEAGERAAGGPRGRSTRRPGPRSSPARRTRGRRGSCRRRSRSGGRGRCRGRSGRRPSRRAASRGGCR